jgi:hypothetical protein
VTGKRTLGMETGSRGEPRYRRPAAEARSAAEVGAASEMGRAAEMRSATDVRAAAKVTAATKVTTAAKVTAATTKVTASAASAAASSRSGMGGACESGREQDDGKHSCFGHGTLGRPPLAYDEQLNRMFNNPHAMSKFHQAGFPNRSSNPPESQSRVGNQFFSDS